ncbi:hypothetical protein VTK56DRAFT_8200 [Thermocarpiscus australiensis]
MIASEKNQWQQWNGGSRYGICCLGNLVSLMERCQRLDGSTAVAQVHCLSVGIIKLTGRSDQYCGNSSISDILAMSLRRLTDGFDQAVHSSIVHTARPHRRTDPSLSSGLYRDVPIPPLPPSPSDSVSLADRARHLRHIFLSRQMRGSTSKPDREFSP